MGHGDILQYLNPDSVLKVVKNTLGLTNPSNSRAKINGGGPRSVKIIDNQEMIKLASNVFIRLAGLSGAAAVAMGAYGSHGLYPRKDVPDELKEVYKTANYYHFLHTVALLAVPLTRRPFLVGSILATGMAIFCGSCYYYALTGDNSFRKVTPYGGSLLIIGWLSMLL